MVRPMKKLTIERRRPGRPPSPISRSRLIEVAREVFAQKGYAGSSLSEIANLAGLRKASLYHHFPSKDSIYLAVLDELVHAIRDQFIASEVPLGGYTARLEDAVGRALDYLEANVEGARILARDMIDFGPFMQAHGQETVSLTLQMWANFLRRGMDAGEFKKQSPEQLIISLVGMALYTYATDDISSRLLSVDSSESRRERLMVPIKALCLQQDLIHFPEPAPQITPVAAL